MVLEGGLGAEGLVHLVEVDLVGGGAFGGEEGGLGAAVFAGVLGYFGFAVLRARAGGFFGIGAVGGEFFGGKWFRWARGWSLRVEPDAGHETLP